jgi:hypothetical protein
VRKGAHLFFSAPSGTGPVLERVTNGSMDLTVRHSPAPTLLLDVRGELWGALGGGGKRALDEPTGIDVIDERTLLTTRHITTGQSIVTMQVVGRSVFAASRSTVYEIRDGRVMNEHTVDGTLLQLLAEPASGMIYVVAETAAPRRTTLTAFDAGGWGSAGRYSAPDGASASLGGGEVWLELNANLAVRLIGLSARDLRVMSSQPLPPELAYSSMTTAAGRLWFLQTGRQTLACADLSTGRLLQIQQSVDWDAVLPDTTDNDPLAATPTQVLSFRSAGRCEPTK